MSLRDCCCLLIVLCLDCAFAQASEEHAPARPRGPYAAWLEQRSTLVPHTAGQAGAPTPHSGTRKAPAAHEVIGEGPSFSKACSIQLDQDLFGPHNQDRDYTQGLELGWFERLPAGQDTSRGWPLGGLHAWLDGQARGLGLPHDERSTIVEARAGGGLAFTPDDLDRKTVIRDDRPYASLLYYGHKRVEINETGVAGSELRLGLLGSRAAEVVQKAIHRTLRSLSGSSEPRDPEGWDNQLAHGGELTLLYRVGHERILAEEHGVWDTALLSGVNLGYQTNAEVGMALRMGRIRNGIESLPFVPIDRATHVPALRAGDCYCWIAGRARVVAYDALLQGQVRSSRHRVHTGDVARVVGLIATGVTLSVADHWQLSYSVNARTRELDHPSRTHYWGGVTLTGRY